MTKHVIVFGKSRELMAALDTAAAAGINLTNDWNRSRIARFSDVQGKLQDQGSPSAGRGFTTSFLINTEPCVAAAVEFS